MRTCRPLHFPGTIASMLLFSGPGLISTDHPPGVGKLETWVVELPVEG